MTHEFPYIPGPSEPINVAIAIDEEYTVDISIRTSREHRQVAFLEEAAEAELSEWLDALIREFWLAGYQRCQADIRKTFGID